MSKTRINWVDQLVGRRVGTIQGDNWVEAVQTILGDQELGLYPYSNELKQDLEPGRINVGIDSYGTPLHLYEDGDFQVRVLPEDERIQAAINPGQTALFSMRRMRT